jgi:hypothetical protein
MIVDGILTALFAGEKVERFKMKLAFCLKKSVCDSVIFRTGASTYDYKW